MASSAAVGGSALILPVFAPLGVASAVFGVRAALRIRWAEFLRRFFTGPGRISRILLLFFVLINSKSMPLAWTLRVFGGMLRHVIRDRRPLPPSALFHPSITVSHTSLLETDYNLHKSNSTYFADLDVARTQAVMHLMRRGIKDVADNARTRIVRDRADNVVRGGFGIGLGAVFCSFRQEIKPYQGYEMWTRVLSWDRKWLYLVTHFVVKGKVRPASWDGGSRWGAWGPVRGRSSPSTAAASSQADGQAKTSSSSGVSTPLVLPAGTELRHPEFQKYVIATAVSKYVFKLGRFTVHPTLVIEASGGLLPERPGEAGWRGGPDGVGDETEDLNSDLLPSETWDWRHTEAQRRSGMEFARELAALDGMHALFDGGEEGALGRFSPG